MASSRYCLTCKLRGLQPCDCWSGIQNGWIDQTQKKYEYPCPFYSLWIFRTGIHSLQQGDFHIPSLCSIFIWLNLNQTDDLMTMRPTLYPNLMGLWRDWFGPLKCPFLIQIVWSDFQFSLTKRFILPIITALTLMWAAPPQPSHFLPSLLDLVYLSPILVVHELFMVWDLSSEYVTTLT
jgi:hypothetical protein